jgi:hypothetical protein
MILLWLVAGTAIVAAFVAWRQARRTAARLEQLTQQYWDLKYQYGELRVQLQRQAGAAPAEAPPPPARTPTEAFVPLTSLKR